ncbi:MAG TPA: DUF2892 domain-containing protein [Bacteroidia bacterium]|nr:DUF2892 domain-containing protein [Sphingobacteriales bacterium]HPD65903.1 DUF2892 domain-containing protein [Bacteroidia bacterium]HRS59590.1 DUF2892 domain-containing protein [Bacteroidia bacterium]HRU67621.1 DUF2892 domain-containing protein [Bacteroidia bacterium]
MKCNMGIFDRVARAAIAVILILLVAFKTVTATWLIVVLIAIAAIFILTAIFAFCPLYLPLKINTKCKAKTTEEKTE